MAEAKTLHSDWIATLFPHSFMLQDVLGSLVALPVFAAVLYAPGYVAGYAADLFGFRRLAFPERSLWAVACSFCVVPVTAYLVGRSAGPSGLCWLFVLCAAAAFALLCRRPAGPYWPVRDRWITALVVLGWTAFVLLMLVDFQAGKKLYFSVVMADQSYRIAFTDAVARTGVPPANPLYFAGSPAPMRYYYFWYVLCAAVVKLAHVSARQSFLASTVWAGFGLIVTVTLFTRHFFRWERRQRWIALALLLVTGADLLPALGNVVLQQSWNGDIEWWSVDPIDAWPDSLLWVPHHVASVLCCMLAFLFLWRTLKEAAADRRSRLWAVALAGAAFASAFGLSVYVAFGFALLMAAWLLWLFARRHAGRLPLLRRVAAASVLCLLALAPFLIEIAASSARATAGQAAGTAAPAGHVFSLSVRRMIDSGLLTGLPVFAAWNRAHPVLLDQGLRLVLLLPGLAMELGLYGAVLVFLLLDRRRRPAVPKDGAHETALFFTLSGLVMTMFLSSSVISNNDFGYRAVMLPQFFLLLLTAEVLGSWWVPGSGPVVAATPGRRRWVAGLLWLGVAGSVYGAVSLRAWLPVEAPIVANGFGGLPQDEFEIRQAFETLDRVAPPNAVVAFRTIPQEVHTKDEVMTPNEFYQRMLVMDTGRQMLNAENKCATHFGGDPAPCRAIQTATAELYASPAPDAEWARQYCSRFGVQYLALGRRDPEWSSPTGWPATLPTVASEPGFRILQCAEGQSR